MQTFEQQAAKNKVTLLGSGPCQCCGAPVTGGIYACMHCYETYITALDYNSPGLTNARFLHADADALQHPEIHGRWNNHLHLTRLHLLLERGVNWTPALTIRLSKVLNRYKQRHPAEVLLPPPLGARGSTVLTVLVAADVAPWAQSVYAAWYPHHATAQVLADAFLRDACTYNT